MPGDATTRRPVLQRDGRRALDDIAVEEPLELRVSGETVAVTLRTPGADIELGLGFLYSEGLIRSAADVSCARHCGRTDEEGYGNLLEVTPAPGALSVYRRLDAVKRLTVTTSACGLCGRKTIDDLLAACGPFAAGAQLRREVVARGPELLRAVQPNFAKTGAMHGAAILSAEGLVLSSAEDVGRHNAVDKAVGALLRQDLLRADAPHPPAILVVSGRAGFDVVQKAAMARLPCVVSVSAATSLAIDLAQRLGQTLVGFARNGTFTSYTHAERLTSDR